MNAAQGEENTALEALETLVHIYWQPLYRYARRKGQSEHDAEDLVQGFLAHLLAHDGLQGIDQDRGRFRAFLLAAFNNFMNNVWRHAKRHKRGHGVAPLSFDRERAEAGLRFEPADEWSPDRLFDREWALALLAKVLNDLEESARAEGNATQFARLKVCLSADSQRIPYGGIAAELGMSEGAVRVAVHRLRKRYRKQLEAEVARTLPNEAAVKDEIEALFAALAG